MEVVYVDNITKEIDKDLVACIGFFDGFHNAHQSLFNKTKEIGKNKSKKIALITFDNSSKVILNKIPRLYLTPLEDKIKFAKRFKFDYIFILQFNKEFANTDPNKFIELFLNNFNTIVCGYDFHFGSNKNGNINTLRKIGTFETVVLDKMVYKGKKIGTTEIKKLLTSGNVSEIKYIMNDYYYVSGKVVHGYNRGSKIGFKTANVDYGNYFIPKNGVYATIAIVHGKKYLSMTNIGDNPTFSNNRITLEVNIFDFNEDIYDDTIKVLFLDWIRDVVKFDSKEQLIIKLKEDKHFILNNYNHHSK